MNTLQAPAVARPLAPAPLSRELPSVGKLQTNAKPATKSWVADYLMLVKPRLTLMALLTVAIGVFLGAGGATTPALLFSTLTGVGLVASGASALNQWLERDTDRLMQRTRNRPLPAGRLQPTAVLRFGVLTSCSGFICLALLVNPLTAMLAVLTLASYVFVYTPLKRWTVFNTLVGAIPGALPPVLGWTAATARLGPEALALFGILFLWQFPHFWAIAWLYRQDYAQAGLRMMPVLDKEQGCLTGRLMVQSCLALIPASLLPVSLGMAGLHYFVGAGLLGFLFLAFAVRFLIAPSSVRARQVLWASLGYLPLVLILLVVDGPFQSTVHHPQFAADCGRWTVDGGSRR